MNYQIEEIKSKLEKLTKKIKEREQEFYEAQSFYDKQRMKLYDNQKKRQTKKQEIMQSEFIRCLTTRHELIKITDAIEEITNEIRN